MPNGRWCCHGCRNVNPWGGRRKPNFEVSSMPCCIWLGPVVNGGCYRVSFRRIRPCSIISTGGATTAFWNASTLNCCSKRGRRRVARQAHRPASPAFAGAGADSQSVKTASGGPCGYDAGKKVKGRKRHIVTDTSGLLVGAEVHLADVPHQQLLPPDRPEVSV